MIAKYSPTNIKDKVNMNVEPKNNGDKFNLRKDTYSK